MYKINFNHLHYFLTIAEEGTIVKASKKLHMTQPALSHQLRLLEEDLGKKLFDRIGRRLVINKNGEHIKIYASKIFRHSEEMLESIKSSSDAIIKIIKIGVVPWISDEQVYDFLKSIFYNQHISLHTYTKERDSLIKDVQNDRLDMVLCDGPYIGRSRKLQAHLIKSEKIICVSSSKDGFKGAFPGCLQNKKVIGFSESCQLGDDLDKFFKLNDITVKVNGEFSNISLIKFVTEKSNTISFLPESIVREGLKKKTLYKLGVIDTFKHSLWAITKKDFSKEGVIGSLLKAHFKSGVNK